MDTTTTALGVLTGIRVLDFTERIQGPYGTQMLGDLGAEVIKVERVSTLTPDGRPDDRYPAPGTQPTLYTAMFLSANRNKKSITLNLKAPEGVDVAHRLVAGSDVVYENFRPGVMDRLGLGYADCAALNPSIVYCSASGYGPDGPYARKPGQDVLAQALGGFGAVNATGGRPTPVGMSVTDVMGGMNGGIAVLAALYHRLNTGEGQHVQVSLLNSAIAAQSEPAVQYLNGDAGEPVRDTPTQGHPYIPPPYGFYATSDGHIALSCGHQVPQLCRVIGLPDLSKDPRFDSQRARERNREQFERIVEDALRRRTTAEWLPLMAAEELFAAPVHGFTQAFTDPQVTHGRMVTTVDSPIGPLRLVSPGFTLTRTPATIRTAPPSHGQHTEQILTGAGYTTEQIAALRDRGVI
ncbi:CaiB/BaiF CoA transferase family protein [Phytohabitans flavus]|uniref:CoA transferase n=1 Tax=Phytohabitans flavus TaxID=1076124 RepID=A0A6F8XWN3_9ACTN|nr:CoA transferase [Phytohabitans flavus]BCB78246.1 CoA transferase [Phytohabitans flavus]